jgi:hypothetical protein
MSTEPQTKETDRVMRNMPPPGWPTSPNGTFEGLRVTREDETAPAERRVEYPQPPIGTGSDIPPEGMVP